MIRKIFNFFFRLQDYRCSFLLNRIVRFYHSLVIESISDAVTLDDLHLEYLDNAANDRRIESSLFLMILCQRTLNFRRITGY